MKYFVIINTASNNPLPMFDSEYNIVLFNSYDEADGAARGNGLALAYGYKVIEWEY